MFSYRGRGEDEADDMASVERYDEDELGECGMVYKASLDQFPLLPPQT